MNTKPSLGAVHKYQMLPINMFEFTLHDPAPRNHIYFYGTESHFQTVTVVFPVTV